MKAIEHPDLGLGWTLPWKVRPCDGKPIIASNRGGNLFQGYIATWQEAELIVAVVNALPDILAALTPDTIGSHFGNGGGFDPESAVAPVAYRYVHRNYAGQKINIYGDHPVRVNGALPEETHPLYAHPPHPAPVDPVPDVRQWMHYPIVMPVNADGLGPATIGTDAARMTYEVWDQHCDTHGSFDCLPDAINEAMRLNVQTVDPVAGWEALRDALVSAACDGIADDYMTSEKHHPGYVLIPSAKFEAILAALKGPAA